MTLYEIDYKIYELMNPETGEIADYDAFEALQMERDAKIENTALWIKDLKAEAEAIRNEEKQLAKRRQAAEKKAESLKAYLFRSLDGEKFKTPRVACSFRRTKSTVPDEKFVEWAIENAPDLLRYETPEADKDKIKAAIEEGREVEHAEIVDKISLTIR